jgi:predicted metal-dependent phosphoesterase TrpH
MHSINSDGLLTPTALVEQAARRGVTAMALTDHDTTRGLDEAHRAAEGTGVRIIDGIEISAWSEREVHILGYFVDRKHEPFQEKLKDLHESRRTRVFEICEALSRYEVDLDPEAVCRQADYNVGRPHVARALMEAGVVKSINEAFDRFLGNGGVAYVPAARVSIEESIQLIRAAGGVSSLAHPGVDGLVDRLPEFAELGIDAVEVDHPSHSRSTRTRLRKSAEQLGLATTGGSDFHHPHGSSELGKHGIDEDQLAILEMRRPNPEEGA